MSNTLPIAVARNTLRITRHDLIPLVEGDTKLLNVYHAYVVHPAKHRKVKPAEACALLAFFASEPAQTMTEKGLP